MYDKDVAGEWIFGELLTKFIGGVYHNFQKDGSCHSRGETHVTHLTRIPRDYLRAGFLATRTQWLLARTVVPG